MEHGIPHGWSTVSFHLVPVALVTEVSQPMLDECWADFICRRIVIMSLLLMICEELRADEVRAPVDARFRASTISENPDFQRHISPLLGRLGCNGRSCHGSFQGQGGLRLSLFGYDFAMDHKALTGRSAGASLDRVNRNEPGRSLLLEKPLLRVDHEGGQRFEVDSWEHGLLRRWIESGAKGLDRVGELRQLTVEPSEIRFSSALKPQQLRVIATWENGDQEDVTPLCRFRSNDDSIAEVDLSGQVVPMGSGDTHVVVFYDNGIIAVPVLRPFKPPLAGLQQERTGPESRATNPGIDAFVDAKLLKLNLVASPPCSDAEFLRRVSLDISGTLPTVMEIKSFLGNPDSKKRQNKIDELLQRPSYAAWWANKLCDFTGCNPAQQAELGQETSVQWYMWIYQRLLENVSYEELVRRIVLSKSRQDDQSYDEYTAEMSGYHRSENPLDFTRRGTMPHYWTRRSMRDPESASQAFAHGFLGIRLQCAQCHKHPFARWTQDDFQEFTGFFKGMKFGVPFDSRDRYRQLAQQVGLRVRGNDGGSINNDVLRQARRGRIIPWRELYFDLPDEARSLKLLRTGTIRVEPGQDPRQPIMDWMASSQNPWFARAFVNRVWASYFHRGLVDPPDDLNPANPASHPLLLDWLSSEFVRQGMDMKWLHRTIASSAAYQRSWKPNQTNQSDRRNLSRMIPRRMPAEMVYDSVKQVLAAPEAGDDVRADLSRRAIGHLSMRLAGTYAMQVFGKPDRAVNCDCERVNQPTLLQAVFLQNDPLIDDRLRDSGWLDSIDEAVRAGTSVSRTDLIREAWLRTLCREPSEQERKQADRYLASSVSLVEGMRDVLWALLNTKEFILLK